MLRRELLQAAIAASMSSFSWATLGKDIENTADSNKYPYAKPLGQFPEPQFIRDSLRLHFGSALQNRSNLFLGWAEDITAHGMAPEPVNKTTLMQFYTGVFEAFPDFRLMDDVLLVAGDMGAHRYHAMGTHTGGPGATGKQIMFRGQTIYRINEFGKVTWRISNHDHDYRESQIAYMDHLTPKDSYRSWAPKTYANQTKYESNKSEVLLETILKSQVGSLLMSASDRDERTHYWTHYHPEARIRGLNSNKPLQDLPLTELRSEYEKLWSAIPDLSYVTDEIVVSGPYVTQQWYAWGHHSGTSLMEREADGKKVFFREQTIYRFDENNKIVERWINHDHEYFMKQL